MFYIIKYLSNKANETLSLFILKLFHFSDYILDPSCSQCRKWNIWNITATCTAILLNSSGFSAKLRSADFFDVKSFTMMSLLLSQNLIQLIYISDFYHYPLQFSQTGDASLMKNAHSHKVHFCSVQKN